MAAGESPHLTEYSWSEGCLEAEALCVPSALPVSVVAKIAGRTGKRPELAAERFGMHDHSRPSAKLRRLPEVQANCLSEPRGLPLWQKIYPRILRGLFR